MKTLSLIAALSLALSVSAAQQGVGSNVGSFGNNKGSSFGASGSANGKNQNNNNNAGKNAGNTGKNTGKNNGAGASSVAASSAASSAAADAASTAAAAASTSTAAANSGAGANSGDAQSSTTLDPSVIATGFANNGQDVPTAGQVASLTSSNNFINFCLLTLPATPLTNGKQITTGSCNPAPMGSIPSTDNMPSAKFQVPKNGDSLPENTAFTITMAISNLETGNFVNAEENYFAAPQQLNSAGQIVGHSHVVVEQLSALDQTTPTNPKVFAFFKGLNAAAVNGVLTADVTAGLPAGFYKVSSINTAANHQPALVPIAQHGSLDDVAYFTVTAAGGQAAAASSAAAASAVASTAAAAPAASSAAAAAAATSTASQKAGTAKGNTGSTKAQQGGQRTSQGKGQQGKQQGKQQGRRHARSFF